MTSTRPDLLLPPLLALALLLLAHDAHATARTLSQTYLRHMCAKQGPAAAATWLNASRTCLTLYSKGAPIQVPDDSNETKWGQLQLGFFGDISFVDRSGQTYPITADVPPPPPDNMQPWNLVIVQAHVHGGNVTRYTPRLYVPFRTIMATMTDTSFEGELYNMRPRPPGPNETSWFKWTFSKDITVGNPTDKYGTLLHGTFVNLFHAALDAQGRCRPALCADPTRKSNACRYYIENFGNSTAITLNWDTAMHAPGDTELVPMFPASDRQYMTSFIELYQLLQPGFSFLPRGYAFYAHGTPMGIPLSFTGTLLKGNATSTKPCRGGH